MVRSVEEVFERLKNDLKNAGIFYWEFTGKILAAYLPKDRLEELGFKVKDNWKPLPLTREQILKEMEDYFPFAVEKCVGCRGISASRSVEHYEAWIWLLGDDEFLEELKGVEYYPYGKPKLVAIAKKYGFDKKFPREFSELVNFEGDDYCW